MLNGKKKELSVYRMTQSLDTLKSAKLCFENGFYKDAINRSYYAAFYAVKSVLALDEIDFKRHKDVVAHFNRTYVSTDQFDRMVGRLMGRLQKKRESSDYDDFYIASKQEACEQIEAAEYIIEEIQSYLCEQK